MPASKAELLARWFDRTLLADIRNPDRPDPVPFLTTANNQLATTDELDTYRQELEAKLIGLIYAQPQFRSTLTNREFVPNRVLYEINRLGPDWLTSDQARVDRADTLPKTPEPLTETTKPDRWSQWADTYVVPDIIENGPVPLFETDDELRVELTDTGRLKRSAAIDERIRTEGKNCVHVDGVTDDGYEGLLYIMYQLADGDAERPTVVPRYIGKAEAYGKKRELSSNFEEIAKDRNSTRSFARWGDGNYWHVSELSMALFEDDTRKLPWASELFEQGTRRLKEQTYLWTCAWNQECYTGPYGYSAYLAEVEPQLIGVAQAAYPETLLNKSDVPDGAPIYEQEYRFESAPQQLTE